LQNRSVSMHIKLLSVAAAATILAGCGTLAGGGGSSEGDVVEATASYVASSTGSIVGSSDGCLYSSNRSDDTLINSCEGTAAKAEKAPEPVAVAAPPPPPPLTDPSWPSASLSATGSSFD